MNLFICTGRLGSDPEAKGNLVLISVPTTSRWRDKESGAINEQTEWHQFKLFGKTGEYALKHLKKGQLVEVTATLHYPKWVDKETGQKRSGYELRAQSVKSLAPAPNHGASSAGDNAAAPAPEEFADDFADLS